MGSLLGACPPGRLGTPCMMCRPRPRSPLPSSIHQSYQSSGPAASLAPRSLRPLLACTSASGEHALWLLSSVDVPLQHALLSLSRHMSLDRFSVAVQSCVRQTPDCQLCPWMLCGLSVCLPGSKRADPLALDLSPLRLFAIGAGRRSSCHCHVSEPPLPSAVLGTCTCCLTPSLSLLGCSPPGQSALRPGCVSHVQGPVLPYPVISASAPRFSSSETHHCIASTRALS